jgi:hypothetical protein
LAGHDGGETPKKGPGGPADATKPAVATNRLLDAGTRQTRSWCVLNDTYVHVNVYLNTLIAVSARGWRRMTLDAPDRRWPNRLSLALVCWLKAYFAWQAPETSPRQVGRLGAVAR